ncbi:hypothetical protein K6119_11395 [Paracrocinitomix mangrovi]|uniref:hypothetical protein n=1 Tax=Paracrocinitomix mangrovi TaxID=2862509 RepID=UPI001C8EDB94|nr:hypothetical protein [Paracrocinitomix mangrovi]UKN00339.1 hypothetical protein K6119_11395 [Paracrocinitomix mangrovi]
MKQLASIFLVFLLSISSKSLYSQDYRHSIGIGYASAYQSFSTSTVSSINLTSSIGVRYMAALKWDINEKVDFVSSIDPFIFAYPSVFSSNNAISGSIDIPLDLKFYFGGIDRTAFFLGAGFNYFWLNWTSSIKTGISSYGPQICLGFNKKMQHLGVGARASYTLGLTQQTSNLTNVSERNNFFSIGVFMLLPSPGELKERNN